MKRILLLIMLLLLFGTPRSVFAELPPHDPAKLQPDPDVPAAQELDPTYRGPIEFYTSQFSDGQSLEIKAGLDFGFHLEDIILPFYQDQDKEISVPDLKPLATYLENAQYLLMPQQVTSKTIHWSEINENIQSNLFCARIFNKSKYSDDQEDISSTGLQLSENVPESQKVFENARKLHAAIALGEIESVNGYYDFNVPKELNSIQDARPYCLANMDSTTFQELENNVTQLSTWGGDTVTVWGYVWETLGHFMTTINRVGEQTERFVYDLFTAGYKVYLTEVTAFPGEHFGLLGDPTTQEMKNTKLDFLKAAAKSRGVAFSFLPEFRADDPDQKILANRAAQTEYQYAVFGKTDGDAAGSQVFGERKKGKTLHPWNILGNADTRTKEMACMSVPQELLDKQTVLLGPVSKGGDTSIAEINEKCGPSEQCKGEPDTWEQIMSKLGGTITNTCKKYKSSLPTIDQGQCEAMMREIFRIEVENDPEISGSNYSCEENNKGAAGPFQIVLESKNLTMCPEEEMSKDDDLSACKTGEKQLSRCVTEDAAEIAMRIILNFSRCNNPNTLSTTQELYDRVCGYYGTCEPLEHLGNKSYCEDVFDAAGIPKPATCNVP